MAVLLPSSAGRQAVNEAGDVHLSLSLSTIEVEEEAAALYQLNLPSILHLKILDIGSHLECF